MISKVLVLLLLCSTAYAQDDQWVWNLGIGAFNSSKNSLSETKILTLGIQEDLWGPLKQRGTVGGWLDDAGNGRSGSALISGQLGFEVDRDGTVASVFFGPCLIGSPDIYLGGPFQFMTDLHLGIQDRDFNYIGIFYRHGSSGGLEMPNVGRDFVGLEIRF
jgi:hypothetical protein